METSANRSAAIPRRSDAADAAVDRRAAVLRALSQSFGALVAGFGVVTLAGWILDVQAMKGLSPGGITVKANAAIAMFLSGVSLLLIAAENPGARALRVARGGAVVVIAIGLLTLSEHVWGWDLGIDQLLFREEAGAAATASPNRMGPPASICFPLIGLALLLIERRSRRAAVLAQLFAVTVLAIATLPLLGYVYGVRELYGIARYTGIALHTAIAFILLAGGVLFARPRRAAMRLFVTGDSGGELVRRLLPAALLAPILLGWLRAQGQDAGLYDNEFGRTLLVLSFMTVFSALTWWTGAAVSRQARARARAESAELELKDRLVRILENISQGFCALDTAGRCTYVNREMERLTGRPRERLLGLRLGEVWPASLHPELHAAVARAGETGAVTHAETAHPDARLWLEHDLVPTAEGVSLFTRDVTELTLRDEERRILLESERRARAAAEHSNRMKDEFLATLSHELRTPLNAILGWAAILAKGGLPESDARRGVESIERNSRLQARLIEDLLDMSRIVSGNLRLEFQEVDPALVVEAALSSLKPTADAKSIAIERRLDPRPGAIRGDPARLQQVLWNLLSNAIKFTPAGGHVEVSLARRGDWVEIAVTDDGIGIDPEFLPRVFDRFRQADSSTTRHHGGLGLGLSIANQLAEMHGGALAAHSDGEGKGASFVLRLPAAAETPRPSEVAPRSAADGERDPVLLAGLRVLVVDDDADARELLSRILRERGAEVAAAPGSSDALEMLARGRYDLLVSDIGMPERDGYSLIADVRRRDRELTAIALTAFVRDEDRRHAIEAGYDAHLPKPIHPEGLVDTVAKLTGRS